MNITHTLVKPYKYSRQVDVTKYRDTDNELIETQYYHKLILNLWLVILEFGWYSTENPK